MDCKQSTSNFYQDFVASTLIDFLARQMDRDIIYWPSHSWETKLIQSKGTKRTFTWRKLYKSLNCQLSVSYFCQDSMASMLSDFFTGQMYMDIIYLPIHSQETQLSNQVEEYKDHIMRKTETNLWIANNQLTTSIKTSWPACILTFTIDRWIGTYQTIPGQFTSPIK